MALRDNQWKMTDGEQQPTQPKPDFLKSAAPWADAFSKAAAGIAIALYACGFLIVSLYHSKFGVVGTNLFRPRVLAAGAWFFFFTAIPVSIAARYRTYPWLKVGKDSAGLWILCYGLGIPLGYMIFDFSTPSVVRMRFWLSIILLGALGLLLTVAVNYSKVSPRLATVASTLLTIFYVSVPLRGLFLDEFTMSSVALWFFGCTVLALAEFKMRREENLFSSEAWSKPLVPLFIALLVFATWVYPHIKTSWGGGTPANVTIYFSKDSLLSPNKAVQAQLIEESDEGFYIVGPKETKAIFVPRSSVAMIYFSDKAADSPMLQNNK